MHKIQSKVEPGRTLAVIHHGCDAPMNSPLNRRDLSNPVEALQAAVITANAGDEFPAHRHHPQVRDVSPVQEAWVVVRGRIEAAVYDTDGTLLYPFGTVWLGAGDCLVCHAGGHGYRCLCNGTLVYEFKTGPYRGRESDKEIL